MDKKEIQWIGVENSRVLNETTRKVGTASHGNNHRRELDEESEEPEDDDMDIEQLQVQTYGLFIGLVFVCFGFFFCCI